VRSLDRKLAKTSINGFAQTKSRKDAGNVRGGGNRKNWGKRRANNEHLSSITDR